MEARTLATAVAYSRVAFGVALMLAPGQVATRWVGAPAATTGGKVLTVVFGARDFAIGLGTAQALRAGSPVRPWLLASAFTDSLDAIATFAGRRSLPTFGALGTVALATSSAAVNAYAAREPDAPAP